MLVNQIRLYVNRKIVYVMSKIADRHPDPTNSQEHVILLALKTIMNNIQQLAEQVLESTAKRQPKP
jgi:hypothetical protein